MRQGAFGGFRAGLAASTFWKQGFMIPRACHCLNGPLNRLGVTLFRLMILELLPSSSSLIVLKKFTESCRADLGGLSVSFPGRCSTGKRRRVGQGRVGEVPEKPAKRTHDARRPLLNHRAGESFQKK